MSIPNASGLFGKLPAHGDFIHRNLPANFINVWDEWLQRFVGGSQEQLGETWLDIYLTSPIWRFVLSAGAIDEHRWAGVLLPSVDRVGRYFPFSVIMRVPPPFSPMSFMSSQADWYEAVEDICLRALDGQVVIDDLLAQVNSFKLNQHEAYVQTDRANANLAVVVDMGLEERSPVSAYPYLLEAYVGAALPSYSVWATRGSERVAPCALVTPALPQISGIAAMMDGQWSQWNWQQPYQYNSQ